MGFFFSLRQKFFSPEGPSPAITGQAGFVPQTDDGCMGGHFCSSEDRIVLKILCCTCTGLMMYWCKKYQYEFNSVISPPSVQEIEMGPAEDSSLIRGKNKEEVKVSLFRVLEFKKGI
ncbi:hypothetical protein Csa_004455 [Cucumis sativus]|nr:hypothetical protein Csa_004455 [Cucumis sativus]